MKALGAAPRLPRWVLPVAVGLASALALWALRPLIVSGDGVGYIKRLVTPRLDVVPGHLVYVPLLEWARRLLSPEGGHGAAARLATAFSSASGGAAAALLFVLARRFTGRAWAGLVAAFGLTASYGFYRASGDVEAYATCVALMTLAAVVLLRPEGQRVGWGAAVLAGLLLGLCTLFHTSLVLFTPFVAFAVARATGSWAKALGAVAVGGALSLASFLLVATVGLGMGAAETATWVLTSDNGYAQRPSATLEFVVRNAGRVFYGVGRTLVHSPAPDRLGELVAARLSAIGITYFVLAAIGAALGLRGARPEVRRGLRPLWAWVLPLLLFGFLFWPSATERWVLVLPVLWLLAVVALSAVPSRTAIGVSAALLLAVPAGTNLATVSAERRLDALTLERSRAASRLLEPRDLLLYPGHTWDEYVGFYEDAPVERFILASFAGEERGDREAFLRRLEDRVEATHRRGGRVMAIRIFEPQDSHHGWSLLRAMGIPRDDILVFLARYEARQVMSRPVGLWEVLPASAAGGSPSPAR